MENKMKTLKRNNILIQTCLSVRQVTFLLIVFFLISSSFAQDKTQANEKPSKIDELVVKLQQKILLTKDQSANLKDILNKLEAAPTAENFTASQKSVVGLLDVRQKAKFEIVKNEWWKEVKQKLGISK
jgi:hypothetical protein